MNVVVVLLLAFLMIVGTQGSPITSCGAGLSQTLTSGPTGSVGCIGFASGAQVNQQLVFNVTLTEATYMFLAVLDTSAVGVTVTVGSQSMSLSPGLAGVAVPAGNAVVTLTTSDYFNFDFSAWAVVAWSPYVLQSSLNSTVSTVIATQPSPQGVDVYATIRFNFPSYVQSLKVCATAPSGAIVAPTLFAASGLVPTHDRADLSVALSPSSGGYSGCLSGFSTSTLASYGVVYLSLPIAGSLAAADVTLQPFWAFDAPAIPMGVSTNVSCGGVYMATVPAGSNALQVGLAIVPNGHFPSVQVFKGEPEDPTMVLSTVNGPYTSGILHDIFPNPPTYANPGVIIFHVVPSDGTQSTCAGVIRLTPQ